jgi:hypothetical protein
VPRARRARCAARHKPRETGPQRIAKLLARAGIASRRDIERMIAEGGSRSTAKADDARDPAGGSCPA